MEITRILPVILSDAMEDSRDFYVDVLGFQVAFDSDWFVNVVSPAEPSIGIGILQRDHETVPSAHQTVPRGVTISIQVEDADKVYADARKKGLTIVRELRDEDYGQRHFMITDPNNVLIDVCTPVQMSGDFATGQGNDG